MKFDVQKLQDFFFEAAAQTYAGNAGTRNTLLEIPGSQRYRYLRSNLLYLDTYLATGEYSAGQTVICVSNRPAWIMQYQGWCKDDNPETLQFLKKALLCAYQEKAFHGGRGPRHFCQENINNLHYENVYTAPPPQCFSSFQGRERIWQYETHLKPPTQLFYHTYQGRLLGETE